MAAPDSSTPPPTIPQMIESLSKLHEKLSSAISKPSAKPQAAAFEAAAAESVAAASDAGVEIEETGDHQAETIASTGATQDHQAETTGSTKAAKLQKLLVSIEHLKGALEKTNELDKKLNEPIQSIEASLKKVIERIQPNTRTESNLNEELLDAIWKDVKTLKFQIPSFKKLSLAGTTADSVDRGTGTKEQDEFRLPNLYGHKVFDESPAFKDIEVIYNGFDNVCKKCFLYFAVFPENVVLKKRFLTYWWIGERLFDPEVIKRPEDHKSPEVFTGKILEKFAEKGLIVPLKEDQKMVKKKFRMPPIVRSAAIKLAKDHKFLDYDEKNNPIAKRPGCDRIFLVKRIDSTELKVPTKLSDTEQKSKEGTKSIFNISQPFPGCALKWLPKLLTGTKVLMAPTDAKVPAGMSAPMSAKTPMGATELTNGKVPAGTMEPTDSKASTGMAEPIDVEVLTDQKLQEGIKSIFNVSQPFPDSALEWLAKKGVVDTRTVKAVEWLLKLINLEVLYLGRWQSAVDEQQIEVESYEFLKGLKKMKKLRLLSLQGISWINKLPNSLRTLSELRVLDLKSCFNLEKLPQGIGSLKNLTHLDVSGCYMLNEMPKSISKLTKLTVLKGFISGRSNLNDLRGLKKLRKLSINVSRPTFPDKTDLHVLQELGELGMLRSLTIMWGAGGVKQPSSKEDVQEPSSGVEVKQPSSGEEVKQPSWEEGEESSSSGEGVKQCLPEKLEKLEVQCLPKKKLPQWLDPSKLTSLKRLYIRGGILAELGDAQWCAEVVRLKYMTNLKIEWRQLQKSFPKLTYLQKVRCPRVTLCPCDANGVWMS